MQVVGERPNAWVMNYADLAAWDMLADADEQFLNGIEAKVFGNLPKIGTTAVPAGTVLLGDFTKLRLVTNGTARLAADASGDLFTHNQAILRYEGRFDLGVLRPSAFIKVEGLDEVEL